MEYGKIVNNEIIFLERPSHILGDISEYARSLGYKVVLHTIGANGLWEDIDYIYKEESEQLVDNKRLRELSYSSDRIINWQGEMLTCDEARLNRMSAYYYSGQTEKLVQLQQLWLDARESIQLQYPDIL